MLFPYLNGEDLNSRPDQSPSRWVINFFDWPLDRDRPEGYEGPVAADYPDCLTIVEERVKPEREDTDPSEGIENGGGIMRTSDRTLPTIAGLDRVLVLRPTSQIIAFMVSCQQD